VTNIGEDAFGCCGSLAAADIPAGVTNIGPLAFSCCQSLSTVTLRDGLASIGWYAFEACQGLTAVVIPDSAETVGYGAFRDCMGLRDVTVGSGVVTMGAEAFWNCRAVTNVTFRGLPERFVGWDGAPVGPSLSGVFDSPAYSAVIAPGVTAVRDHAFSGCSGLAAVTIPPGVTSIGEDAFGWCWNLVSADLPEGVTNVGPWAFAGCVLASVKIPDSVVTVGYCAFVDCQALADVTIGSGIAELGKEAFWHCDALTNVTLRGIPGTVVDGYGKVLEPSSLWRVFDDSSYSLVIAEGVTRVPDFAFEGCAGLVRVSLPTSLTNIGMHAFTDCALTGVFVPSQVSSIGSAAFSWCWRLESITVDGANPRYYSLNGVLLDRVGHALVQCPTRKAGDFTVPTDVTHLADSAFSGCVPLVGLYFKGDAPTLGEGVFSGTDGVIAYRLAGASGWGDTLDYIPVVLWNPQVQAGAGFGPTAEGFAMTIGSAGSPTVVVEACTNLFNATWLPVGVISGGTGTFCDPNWRSYGARYYRLRMP
jgi:hypothetical protein